MSTNRRTYDAEFKRNTVALAAEAGKTVSEVAAGLGVAANLVYRWRREFTRQGGLSFPGQGKQALTAEQRRVRELEKQLRDVEMERDILKKALAIFSKAPK